MATTQMVNKTQAVGDTKLTPSENAVASTKLRMRDSSLHSSVRRFFLWTR